MLNEDYKELLHALSDEKVKYLLVGADTAADSTAGAGRRIQPELEAVRGCIRHLPEQLRQEARLAVWVVSFLGFRGCRRGSSPAPRF